MKVRTVATGLTILFVAVSAMAQNNGANTRGVEGTLSATADANQGESQSTRDKMFLREAAETGLAAVQLSQLAVQKAGSDEVRQLAQKIVHDRIVLNESMSPIADEMGVRSPTKLGRRDHAELGKLSSLSGEAFDREYLVYLVKSHRADQKAFRDEEKKVTDAGLKSVVDRALTAIDENLTLLERLAAARGIK
ncbi:DUF4142 domain-containing protein [Granulicella arctica]|uniref:DUF4142 domain-containing protein n=1 Tax=Granulicella arctica TaxID=940613 RepID=UPI0021DF9E00|nr:DUF4142 domain-containing protein [Granulicella arctica]